MLSKDLLPTPITGREFQEIYRTHYAHVYAYFRRRTTVESAQDGTAETFLVAWRRRGDLPDSDRVLPWLYGVAKRVLANQRRSGDRRRRLSELLAHTMNGVAEGPESVVIRDGQIQSVLDALNNLRVDDREVIRMAQWEGLSHAEIANVLGCKPHAVDQRMHRAMRRLGRELEESRAETLFRHGKSKKGGPA